MQSKMTVIMYTKYPDRLNYTINQSEMPSNDGSWDVTGTK